MTGAEAGFLLLTSSFGDPERKVLTTAQLRILSGRVKMAHKPEVERDLQAQDLMDLGYGREMAEHILQLLEEEQRMRHYCQKAQKQLCFPLTWASSGYPQRLKQQLKEETPGCIWCKGDISLLSQPKVALVGSRDLQPSNGRFAYEVGLQAAQHGYVLVSGNARGADQAAQNACLQAGGRVICVVADTLTDKPLRENVLYITEDGFDLSFTAQRAISRNRLIHALAEMTFVAQSSLHRGGTWDGTSKNLRHGWSPVYLFADGSTAMDELAQMGGELISQAQLHNFEMLPRPLPGFLEE